MSKKLEGDEVTFICNFIDEMPHHIWGEENFDWKGLDDAIEYIQKYLLKRRVEVRQAKEKFGQARIYCSLGFHWWSQLTHPGYVYNQWPKWTWKFSNSPRWLFKLINRFVVPYHIKSYRAAYAGAIKLYPHLRAEILACPDFPEFLKEL